MIVTGARGKLKSPASASMEKSYKIIVLTGRYGNMVWYPPLDAKTNISGDPCMELEPETGPVLCVESWIRSRETSMPRVTMFARSSGFARHEMSRKFSLKLNLDPSAHRYMLWPKRRS